MCMEFRNPLILLIKPPIQSAVTGVAGRRIGGGGEGLRLRLR
jgi:hypothetical protein